ncbi:MAG: DUF2225 domain-containing protein [Spirochaetales bacterium]|nr:DUF2225 domain-containing protein [Spirochaetales bacterium]
MSEEKNPAVTFFQKNKTVCPVCETNFFREELLTGRGRLIAGNLTSELRRLYEPSQKFGSVAPLKYSVVVCPNCYYSAWKDDFLNPPKEKIRNIEMAMSSRIEMANTLFSGLDFRAPRRLEEGIASYVFALSCYDYFPKETSPLVKQGITALRGAWLAVDSHQENPGENYLHLAKMLYHKASFFYNYALEMEQKGKQSVGGCPNLGPDLDKNYGYDGLIYLAAYLEFHHGPDSDNEVRKKRLSTAKKGVARIFGMGRASKSKPQAILDNARELYQVLADELGIIDADPEKDAQEE